MEAGSTISLFGNVVDQFGLPMESQPGGITWSVSSGGGNITHTGVYAAPGIAGVCDDYRRGAWRRTDTASVAVVGNLDKWYRADEVSGGTLADSGGQNQSGTIAGTHSFGPGVRGNALNLTGGGYAALPTGIVSDLNDFTIATWVKVATLDNWARIFDFGSGTGVNMFMTPMCRRHQSAAVCHHHQRRRRRAAA
jgi:hypothetical protein